MRSARLRSPPAIRLEHDKIKSQEERFKQAQLTTAASEKLEHDRHENSWQRYERLAWGVLVFLGGVVAFLLSTGHVKEAVAVFGLAFTHAVALVGGMGVQKMREKRKSPTSKDE